MSNVTKSKRPRYNSEIRRDKVRNKTRICIGDAFERWRRLKTEKNLNTDANVAIFLLDRYHLRTEKHEREGVEYHFVTKHTFEKDILNHKFLEYGEYKGNYYGMSLDSVRRVIAESKVCLLDVKPHEENFQDMITSAQAMENKYGHLFENVIINDDLAMAFTELRDELAKIETETHWIPNTWAHV